MESFSKLPLPELFSVKYADKDTAVMVYRALLENSEALGFIAVGLEKFKTRTKRRAYRIILAVPGEMVTRVPAILSTIKDSLRTHPLFPYLFWDSTTVPITKTDWNFDSYDDKNYQKIFIRKRKD